MTTIVIVYRDNDLFGRYVPRIKTILQSLGHSVAIKVVARGVEPNKQEISDWLDINHGKVLADRTCRVSLDHLNREARNSFSGNGPRTLSHELDSLIGGLIARKFRALTYCEGHSDISLDQAKSLFQSGARAMAEKFGAPTHVVIDPRYISSHWYRRQSEDLEVLQTLDTWIREIFSDCQVMEGQDPPKQGWVIADRHQQHDATLMVLRLPVETMIDDLASFGLLPLEVELTDDELEKVLKRRLDL